MSAQNIKRPSPQKLALVIVVSIIFILGSIVMIVFGSTLPGATSNQKIQNGALLGIGIVVLILTVVGLSVYLGFAYDPEKFKEYIPTSVSQYLNAGY